MYMTKYLRVKTSTDFVVFESFSVYTSKSYLFCLHDKGNHKTSCEWGFDLVTMKVSSSKVLLYTVANCQL